MSRSLRRDAAALALFGALTLVMTNPLVLHLGSAVEDKHDAVLNVWIVAWVGHALITDPINLFHTNIFYPYLNTLAYSETLLPQGALALPFNLAFANTVLGYNLVLFSAFYLSAYAMYLLAFDLTRSRSAAIIAGVIFSFSPFNLGNLAQVQTLSFGWMPLVLLFLRRLLSAPDHRRDLRARLALRLCVLFALYFVLQALSSFYFAFYAGIGVAIYSAWFLIASRHPSALFFWTRLARLAISGALLALVVVPFTLPYFQVQRDLGFERVIEDSEVFSATPKQYTEVSPQNVVYGRWLAPQPIIFRGAYPLDNLFPGLIALALGLFGILAAKERERWFFTLLLGAAFTLSFGPRLYLTPTQATDITLPYRWLYDWFPPARALRAPDRFDVLVMFALAALAALGFHRVLAKMSESRRAWVARTATVSVAALIALEYLAVPAATITPLPIGDAIPPYVHWLAMQPRGVILELPMVRGDPNHLLDLSRLYFGSYHWQASPDGYSGFNPPRRGEIAYETDFFPSERSIRLLQVLDIQFVVLHAKEIEDWQTRKDAIARVAELQLAQQFGDDYIYRLAPRPAASAPLDARLYLPQPAAPGQPYTAYLITQNRSSNSFALKPTEMPQVEARWSDGSVQRVTLNLPLVTTNVSVTPIHLRAPAREGNYRLDLRVLGKETGEWGLGSEVSVQAGDPARQVAIPASVVLRAPLKAEYARGAEIAVDVNWLPHNKVDAYYSASVRIVNARGEKIAAEDREPSVETLLWVPGITVPDRFTLELPRDIAPGEYALELLMYQPEQGLEVWLLDKNLAPLEKITLGRFTVK